MKCEKVLFVCTGNMCRSPMAEVIFEEMVSKDPELCHSSICPKSAGILNLNHHKAAGDAIKVMLEKGLDISQHMSKGIDENLVNWADIILVMESKHEHYLVDHFSCAAGKVHLLTRFAGEEGDVPNPIDCGAEMYRECADQLVSLLNAILERIKLM